METDRTLRFRFLVDGEEIEHRVHGFWIREALSVGWEGWLELQANAEVDTAAMTGKPCTLKVESGGDLDRVFQGVVFGGAMKAVSEEHFRVRIDVGARLHLLRLGQNLRLFQEKNVKEVVTSILEEGDLAGDSHKWHLEGTYPTLEVFKQDRESDEAFIRRLLADAGIGFAIHHTEDKDVVVLFDSLQPLEAIEGDDVLWDRAATGTRANTVWDLHEVRRSRSDTVMLRDYNPAKPKVDLTFQEKADGARGREVYLHPGGFLDTDWGKTRAKRTLERVRMGGVGQQGRSDCPMLEPGRTFAMENHKRDAINRRFRVVSVLHEGGRPAAGDAAEVTYMNQFEAIPDDAPFRPAPLPAPMPSGVEVAFVTGADGQELHGNAHGEVRVRYPWDRSGITNDKSSPWLRVGQLALGGSMIIPRVGFEVLVDHELGHLDRPLVVGHLYNGEALPPYELPAGATRSTLQTATTASGGGANELRFEDAAGSEEIFLNASRDLKVAIENESDCTVGNDEKCEVGGNRSVKIGANSTGNVSGARTVTVNADQKMDVGGDFTQAVAGTAKLAVGGVRKISVKGDLTENIAGTLDRKVGGLQSVTGMETYMRTIGGASETQVGAAWLEVCGASKASTCGPLRTETVGALKMIKAKTVAVSCGAAYGMNAASEQVNCGGNRNDTAKGIIINAGGGLNVKAANINITGEDKVILRVGGTQIEVTSSSVTIKSPKATLKGNKAVGHKTQHKSG
ncbi:MAG: type VI secretion system Vgr family protein [Myxococcaceae bacterium]